MVPALAIRALGLAPVSIVVSKYNAATYTFTLHLRQPSAAWSKIDMKNSLAEISKFLSFVLRHEPDAIGITLDRDGWTDIDGLIEAARASGKQIDRNLIDVVVGTNDKKRFAISEDGSSIRAVQGHSSKSVAIAFSEAVPPQFLYHGTATRFIDSIRIDGLHRGARHHVHLSQDPQTAVEVGQRHGKPLVLTISALLMHERGMKFFQAANGIWLTDAVPPCFIHEN